MLFLNRREKDKGIVVELPSGQIMEIFVEKIMGRQVRIGFKNHENVKVWRGEIYDKIMEQKL